MASRDERSETERLLAEAEAMISGTGSSGAVQRSVQPHGEVEPASRGLTARLRAALIAGAVAGVSVWLLFALLPFLRAGSGGSGAFLATFVAVFLFRRPR